MAGLSLSSMFGLKFAVPQNNNRNRMPIRSGEVYKSPMQLQRRSFKIHAHARPKEEPFVKLLKKYTKEENAKVAPIAYNFFIEMLSSDQRLREAFRLRRYLEYKGIPLTARTCLALVKAMCVRGKINEALDLFDKAKSMPDCEPDEYVYSALIKRLCKEELFESALGLVEEMTKRGLTPDCQIVYVLVEALCEKKYYSWATDLVHVNCPPDVEYYNSVFRAFEKAGEPALAKDLFSVMQERGVDPDYMSYIHLFMTNLGEGLYREAYEIEAEMKRKGFWDDEDEMLKDGDRKLEDRDGMLEYRDGELQDEDGDGMFEEKDGGGEQGA